jgi:hypothetical protein
MISNNKILLKLSGVKSIISKLLYWITSEERKIKKFKSTYKNKPILIIGNGPSLKKTPLKDFKGIGAIGMNKINLLFDKTTWRPSHIVCINGLVIQQNKSFFKKTSIPVFLDIKARLLGLNDKKTNFFKVNNNQNFSNDFGKGVGSSPTVTYAALQLAYYLEANPIIIFGVDHSFKVKDKGDINKIEVMKEDDPNHFDSNYFKGQKWGYPDLDGSELVYQISKDVFDEEKIKIYDATIDGKLEIFEKISIEAAKKVCGL